MAKRTSCHAVIAGIDLKTRAATLQALKNASDDIQSTGRDTVREWKHRVEFGETVDISPYRLEVLIKPTGRNVKIFTFVDKGTKGPYPIPKVIEPGKWLRFQVGYSARTMPIAKYNVGTGTHFGAWVTKKQVQHPGIKKREFLLTYMEDLIPSLQVRVQVEINQVFA
jgi:hypothetical protein